MLSAYVCMEYKVYPCSFMVGNITALIYFGGNMLYAPYRDIAPRASAGVPEILWRSHVIGVGEGEKVSGWTDTAPRVFTLHLVEL